MSQLTITPTVLVVDDDASTRETLADLLRGECRILLARDGASALNILSRTEVHLVLLDVSMAGMSGYEVLQTMRLSPQSMEIPVIFITALSDEAEEEHGLNLGAADYVQKPIRPAIVRARVLTHLKLSLQRRDLALLAARDGLTGVASRRAFDEGLDRAVAQALQLGTQLALAMFDVDHFKLYNDRYGHGAGDDVLRQIGEILARAARSESDLVARYGGEEFAVLTADASEFAQRMEATRMAVLQAAIAHDASPTHSIVTISGGGVLCADSAALKPRHLLEAADALLYRAKAEGRNRVIISRHPGA